MSKGNFISSLLLICCLPSAYAYTGFGICNFGKQTIDTVICYGPTVLKDTIVTGEVKVAGLFKAFNVNMGDLTVTGDAEIKSSDIKGLATIVGYLNATDTIFESDVNVTAKNTVLKTSSVKGSVSISASVQKPNLQLYCGTKINGSVTFKGEAGVVQITDDSSITGKVNNGQLEFVKIVCK